MSLQEYFIEQRKEYERIIFESKFVIQDNEKIIQQKNEFIQELKDRPPEKEITYIEKEKPPTRTSTA